MRKRRGDGAITPAARTRPAAPLAGVLDLAIPSDLVEDSADWDAWFEGALAAAFADGRWSEAASIVRSEVGYLNEDGRFRPVT